ncbi:MAG: ecdysteroid 22-kinase family protein [Epsilonproteobacteria bacterium]|nr:ecdysteroid 22-kinase family protein [Campylobacterota bacterium]
MQIPDTPKNTPLYQEIGDDLNLGTLIHVDVIQTLWSGYGELVRLIFSDTCIIIKHVKLPKPSHHPRGWNSDHSHQRKLHSYQVEVNWYQNFSIPHDERCPIPQGLKCFQTPHEWLIVMEDLATLGFGHTTMIADKSHLNASLCWLANFHARYMHIQTPLVWEVGTYWHLETRLDELEVLEEGELKNFAQRIDTTLKKAKYQTIVHGDAKLANFCFNDDANRCAAVDFQYVGHGCGMKDVAYFMSSAIEPKQCEVMQTWILDTYFIQLKEALAHYQPHIESEEVEQEWRVLFAVAWADFQRFIKGWSPDHYKINTYTESLTTKALKYLKSKA